jgi:hypothetical protein
VTSRQHAIEAITRAWLEKYYPQCFVGALFGNHYGAANSGSVQSKPDMCRSIRAVALIDDSLTYASQCSAVLEKVLLFDRAGEYAWNKEENSKEPPLKSNVVRCLSWDAVYEQLKDWQPKVEGARKANPIPE